MGTRLELESPHIQLRITSLKRCSASLGNANQTIVKCQLMSTKTTIVGKTRNKGQRGNGDVPVFLHNIHTNIASYNNVQEYFPTHCQENKMISAKFLYLQLVGVRPREVKICPRKNSTINVYCINIIISKECKQPKRP